MGKNPQDATEKSQKSVKSAPSWRAKLEEYDINNIYEGRTCEIILMAELTIFFSEAIRLFHAGANNNPTNPVKSINFECFASDMKQGTKEKAEKPKSKGDPTAALFQAATAEALLYVNTSKSVPVELIANLLKLKIINMINEDVILRNEERILEIEKLKLASEAVDKKGKADKGNAEKGAENKKPKRTTSNVKLPMEERRLYFLISGIYEPSLVEELYKIGIPLTAILELSSPECVIFKEKYAGRSETPIHSNPTLGNSVISNTVTESEGEDEEIVLFINQFYAGSKESVCYSVFGGEQSISSITSSIQEKITSLNTFWTKIYEELEGHLQAKCLESAAHIRIQPLSASHEDKNPEEVFLEISKPIIKLSDMKRQHLNYLRKLKLCKIASEPKDLSTTSLKTYRKLIDMVPSDCCTIGLVLYCLVEEVCARVSDPKPHGSVKANSNPSKCPVHSKSIPNSSTDVKREPKRNLPLQPKVEPEERGTSLKQLANYVIQCKNNYSHLVKCGITYRQYKFDRKLKLKLSKEPFVIHETNWLEYKLSTYQELSKLLLKININILKKCPAALLWNDYLQLKTIEVVYKNHQLETWRHLLNLSKNDLHCALSAIQFDLLPCYKRGKIAAEPKNSLQMLFPEKNESEVLKAANPHVKYIQTPNISLTSLNDRESGLRIPEVPYSDVPNIHEAKNIPAYLWYETLPHEVMVQQLQKANSKYVCLDHKYCPYNDALILRYHNNVDTFGMNSRIWTQFLRTPVCFRDFCKYILHEEARWLEREEDDYQIELKALKKRLILSEATDRRTSIKKLSIRRGNSKVSNQDTSQSRRTSSKKLSAQCVNPLETNQNISKSQRTSIKNLSTQSEKPEGSYGFVAYDLGVARIQLTGATTIFHSMDGYKVIVDRTSLIGRPNKLSVNVAVAGHNVILHCNRAASNEPFMFHFCLSDGTILVFAKPTPFHKAEISIAEKSKISKHKPKIDSNSYQPREKKYYYVTEIKRWYLKTVKMPTVARKSLLLDEDFMPIFLEQLKKNFIRPIRTKTRRKFHRSFPEKCFTENILTPENTKEVLTLYVSPTVRKSSLKMDELTSETLKAQKEQIEILKKIEEARKLQIPLFKVYSSKLHKFEYIRRVKSHLHITVGRHKISLPCKHRTYKVSRAIEVVKVAPVKLSDAMFYNNSYYDMKMSLPSGLLIYTIAGVNSHAFNIRQKYVEKNPYCKNVANEDSRTFMRNGHVVVKRNDGTLDIYSASGQIIHCEIPHSTVHTHTKYKLKTKPSSEGNQKIRLTRLESKLCRIVNWRRRHIIGGPESRYFKYRRKNIRQHNLQAKHSNNVYVMHTSSNPLFEFTLITHDGKQLKVTNTRVRKQDQFFQTTLADEYYDENINIRDDGTTHMIYGGGIFTTQFNDKTKISSWFAESPELITIEDDDSLFGMESLGSYFYEQVSDNGWIFVEMFYKFEHPNYATVLYSKDNYETEINLPNHVIINVTENGHYFVDVEGVVSSVINEELVYLESKTCDTCMQRSITVLNIKPLYDGTQPIEENTELLKTCDSYEKIFLVKYNGKCFRNSNYVKYRTNRAHCSHHDKEDHQQLFVLNRDLSGSKFWDVRAYRERVIQATNNNRTVLQYYGKNTKNGDYTSLEFRTYEYKPYHMRFMNEGMNDDLLLSSNSANESNPQLPAFTTLCHIHSMPKECMTKLLETTMMENSKQKGEFPKSDHKNVVCKCASQIGREIAKLQGKSVFDEHLAKISSALLLRKKWCSWHELNKPYLPSKQTCKCKSDANQETLKPVQLPKISQFSFDENPTSSVEIMPDRSVSESVIESHMKPHKTVCECNIPASFVCECKKSSGTSECTEMETPRASEGDHSEANHRIASINDWSHEVDFLDDFYIFAEEGMTTSDEGGMSISNTIIQEKVVKPPPYKYNTDKNSNQRPIAPKHRPRKTCTKDTCSKHAQISVKVSSTNSELPSRQAGGADLPPNLSNIRKINKAKTQPENVSKAICRKIIQIVLASSILVEVSSERAEHCKIAVAINIMNKVSQAHLSASQLLYFLQNLNDLDINQHEILSAEQLSHLILSLCKNNSKDVNGKSKIITSTIGTIKATKHKKDLAESTSRNHNLQPPRQIIHKTR